MNAKVPKEFKAPREGGLPRMTRMTRIGIFNRGSLIHTNGTLNSEMTTLADD